ncbi:MAG: Zn-ribbon domain-containing OB-fold protein [Hyphomonadaceae bacterium]|nr:Zn-ribbon domain-containing OB-fold protein [Hyphomonadaceae bacterium]MBX3509899.1 Zn-ribbon domain-containing OB-fold protein [Hyphomonadaceae bacterium]
MAETLSLPAPTPTGDSKEYWSAANDGRLILRACRTCGKPMFYPRGHCPACGSGDLEWREASGEGVVHACTIVHRAPDQAFRARAPYVIALVDLKEGPRMMANITDCPPEEVRIGMPVTVWFEARSETIAIPQFRPAQGEKK